MAEVEEIFKKLQAMRGVEALLCLNFDGIAIRTTADSELTAQLAYSISRLVSQAIKTIRELDSSNELTFLRLRSKSNEIMVSVDLEHSYALAVIQKANDSQQVQQVSY